MNNGKSSTSKTLISLSTLALAASLLLSGCAGMGTKDTKTTIELSGAWYGQDARSSETLIWLNKRSADGTFKLAFKKCAKQKETFYQLKEGNWNHSGATYKTTTTALSDYNQTWSPATPNGKYTETYQIIRMVGDELHYNSNRGKYVAYKVADDYELTCGFTPEGLKF